MVREVLGGRAWRAMAMKVHGNAKLTWDNVKVIRAMKGSYSAAYTARYWAVGKQTILDIWQGRTWKWVE